MCITLFLGDDTQVSVTFHFTAYTYRAVASSYFQRAALGSCVPCKIGCGSFLSVVGSQRPKVWILEPFRL